MKHQGCSSSWFVSRLFSSMPSSFLSCNCVRMQALLMCSLQREIAGSSCQVQFSECLWELVCVCVSVVTLQQQASSHVLKRLVTKLKKLLSLLFSLLSSPPELKKTKTENWKANLAGQTRLFCKQKNNRVLFRPFDLLDWTNTKFWVAIKTHNSLVFFL